MSDTRHQSAAPQSAGQTSAGPDDLLPLDHEQGVGFDVVRFGGYDRRQVDDYLDRVEVALTEADQRHADDRERLAALQ
ncbi:MAG: DivIVA domain-containing protein, partial [Mycobacteriales bacterium]